nr:hypothetical protein [uncultured Lichenicoccus sp.]
MTGQRRMTGSFASVRNNGYAWRWPALVLLLASACDPREITIDPALAQFDGLYRGTVTNDQTGGACSGAGGIIKFEVTGGQISVQTHHHANRLAGTVDADGAVYMQTGDGSRQISGSIQNGVLSALETSSSTSNQNPFASATPPCSSTVKATRIS